MGTRANQPNPSHHMKTTMSQGEKSIDARLYCGSTFGDEAEATIEIKAKGIHHTDLAPLISSAPDLLEACKGVFALFAQPLETSSHTQWALWNDPETVPEWRALRDAIDRATTQKEGAK